MDISFRDLARRMDPVDLPDRLRGLAGLHRWLGGPVPGRLAFRGLADRHLGATSRRVRLLWLNTELLISAGARHERVRELAAILTDPEHPYDIVALCEVLTGLPETDVRFDLHHGLEVDMVSVPDLLIQEVRRLAPDVAVAQGPVGEDAAFGSGLVTFSFGHPIVGEPRSHVFRTTGSSTVDSMARKGVLLTSVDIGPGVLDFYSTHFASGVRPIELPLAGEHVPDTRRTQLAQVGELLEFYVGQTSRHLDRVSVVCGDFNIAALDTERAAAGLGTDDPALDHRDRFFERMSALRFTDCWPGRGGDTNYTFYDRHDGVSIGFICHPARDHGRYCDDEPRPGIPAISEPFASAYQRLDYVFVEDPEPRHAIIVDWARPRRLPFHRPPGSPERDEHPTMSDHLGIEVELIVSRA